jgi:Rieske Fe-S protein
MQSCEDFTSLEDASQGVTKIVDLKSEALFPVAKDRQNLAKIGYGVKLRFKDVNYSIPLILVRLSADEVACYSSLCTHDNCFGKDVSGPLGNYPGFKEIACQCHGSRFDPFQNGKAVKGPAEKPLKKFKTTLNKETQVLTIEF